MRAIKTLFGMGVLGALGTPLVMFIYQSFQMISQGVSRDQMPLQTLLIDKMNLDLYALLGGAGGLALGLIIVLAAAVIGLVASRRQDDEEPGYDPDQIIRSQRAEVADAYLEKRRTESRSA